MHGATDLSLPLIQITRLNLIDATDVQKIDRLRIRLYLSARIAHHAVGTVSTVTEMKLVNASKIDVGGKAWKMGDLLVPRQTILSF